MKIALLLVCAASACCFVAAEPPASRRQHVFRNWPPLKVGNQVALGGGVGRNAKQKTFVVQIRSDDPVPLVLKGRPSHGGSGIGGHLHRSPSHVRGVHHHPIKLTAPIHHIKHYNAQPLLSKQVLRKPPKLKLNDPLGKFKHNKPAVTYGAPFKYEKPSTVAYADLQKLPFETHANFLTDHYTPLHTIPAPNLGLSDNHLSSRPDDKYLPPAASFAESSSTYHDHQSQTSHHNNNNNQYQVIEENTNDQTIFDPLSGSQKLFAPDPDPSLPAAKIRPSVESFNRPSNGQPLPVDVQTNYLLPAQPLVQIVGAQALAQTAHLPEIYPVQAQLQPLVSVPAGAPSIAAVAAGAVPIYNPTYLVTQSNNLYSQHQQQLFKPTAEVIAAGYGHADLTQHVATNGQILQAASDPLHHIHPVLDGAPQFAALIAAPALEQEQQQQQLHQHYEPASFRLPNVAAVAGAEPEGGFIVSNYYSNPQDSSQLLQAYAEEESQRQQLEAHHASIELQRHQQQQHAQQQQQHEQADLLQQQHEQADLLQQQQNHLFELQQHQHHEQLQQQQQHEQLQQHQLHQQHKQQHNEQLQQQQHYQQQQPQQHSTLSVFEEHQRLVQQQLGADTPLRIFVPDDEGSARLQKRADHLHDEAVNDDGDSFEVSTSVEVSNERHDIEDTATEIEH